MKNYFDPTLSAQTWHNKTFLMSPENTKNIFLLIALIFQYLHEGFFRQTRSSSHIIPMSVICEEDATDE